MRYLEAGTSSSAVHHLMADVGASSSAWEADGVSLHGHTGGGAERHESIKVRR